MGHMEYMWNIYGIQLSMEYDEYDCFKCPFQEPKLEGTYNVQVLRQGIPPEIGFTRYGTSILGS